MQNQSAGQDKLPSPLFYLRSFFLGNREVPGNESGSKERQRKKRDSSGMLSQEPGNGSVSFTLLLDLLDQTEAVVAGDQGKVFVVADVFQEGNQLLWIREPVAFEH